MSKKQFIDQNKDVFYTGLSSEQREMKMGYIYDRIEGRLTGIPSL